MRAASSIAWRVPMPIPISRWPACWPACITGLRTRSIPDAPAVGNVSREPDLALPFTIDDALARLEGADELETYLGEETLTLYRETKRIETQRLRKVITAAEYDWYL